MIFSVLLIVLVLAVGYFHWVQGVLGGVVSMALAIVAGTLAVGYHEWAATALLNGKLPDTSNALMPAGNRVETADKRKDYSNSANLVRAMGMLGRDKPAILVRLFVQPMPNAIVAQPLAALTAKHHLRVGL